MLYNETWLIIINEKWRLLSGTRWFFPRRTIFFVYPVGFALVGYRAYFRELKSPWKFFAMKYTLIFSHGNAPVIIQQWYQ